MLHYFMIALAVAVVGADGCAKAPVNPITEAAAHNDVATLRDLLKNGHRADETSNSWTALIWAARSGSVDAVTLLLDSGADVNQDGPTGDDWDATPLQHAILERQPAVVRLLLERGADPNRGSGRKSLSPLFLAAGDADPTILTLLLAHGVDVTAEDETGATPLARAVSAGTFHGPDRPMFGGCRGATVRALLAHDPELRSKHKNAAWTDAVWWARAQRCQDVLRLVGE
jgi:ankyrin repeat protein